MFMFNDKESVQFPCTNCPSAFYTHPFSAANAHKYAKMWVFYSTVLWVPLYLNKIIRYSYLSDVDTKDGTRTSLMNLKPVISAGCADTSSPEPEI